MTFAQNLDANKLYAALCIQFLISSDRPDSTRVARQHADRRQRRTIQLLLLFSISPSETKKKSACWKVHLIHASKLNAYFLHSGRRMTLSRVEATRRTLSAAHRGKSIGGRSPLFSLHDSSARVNSTKFYIYWIVTVATGLILFLERSVLTVGLKQLHRLLDLNTRTSLCNTFFFAKQQKQRVKLLVAGSDAFAGALLVLLRSSRRYLRVGFISCCWFILLVNVYSQSVPTRNIRNGMRTTRVYMEYAWRRCERPER